MQNVVTSVGDMTTNDDTTIVDTLRKASTAVYLCTDEETARHISITFRRAANRIEYLEGCVPNQNSVSAADINQTKTAFELALGSARNSMTVVTGAGARWDQRQREKHGVHTPADRLVRDAEIKQLDELLLKYPDHAAWLYGAVDPNAG